MHRETRFLNIWGVVAIRMLAAERGNCKAIPRLSAKDIWKTTVRGILSIQLIHNELSNHNASRRVCKLCSEKLVQRLSDEDILILKTAVFRGKLSGLKTPA